MIELVKLAYNPGLFLSCSDLADANDIVECLTDSDFEFKRVGYTGVWVADAGALKHVAADCPGITLPDPPN